MNIQETMKAANQKVAAMQQELQELGEKTLADATKALFEKYPQVHSIEWTQWIPGFNDGDPCEFTVGDVCFLRKLTEEEEEEKDECGYLDEYDTPGVFSTGKVYDREKQELTEEYKDPDMTEEFAEDINAFSNFVSTHESVWERLFGPDQWITITRDGVSTRDYDCGY